MTSFLIRKYDVIIIILMSRNLRKWKVLIVFVFVFGWIKLKFGARGNFRLLISNLHSKMQYQFAMLRKCHFFPLDHDFEPSTPS